MAYEKDGYAMRIDRWLHLDGAHNVRDLGGLATVEGRRTRWRAFLRADSLHQLTSSSQRQLAEYGLGTVVDLRRTRETVATPNVFCGSGEVRYLHVNMIGDTQPPGYGVLPADGVRSPAWVSQGYQILLDHRQTAIRDILGVLSRTPPSTVLFHCAGGTDRTGIIAALLLGLAGVPWEVIVEDYSLSADGLLERFLAEGIPQDFPEVSEDDLSQTRAREVLAPPEAMHLTLEFLAEKYGGIEGYLRRIGLVDDQIENMRGALQLSF